MKHQAGPSVWVGAVFICVAIGIFLLGRAMFRGSQILDDQWRERHDLQIIRRILGGGFMLFGGVFGIAGMAIVVISAAHAMH